MPSKPDLFFIFPPVIVPKIDVFFSDGVPCGVPGFMLPTQQKIFVKFEKYLRPTMRINYNPPDVLSSDDRSSKGISPGGRKPLLNFSITSAES